MVTAQYLQVDLNSWLNAPLISHWHYWAPQVGGWMHRQSVGWFPGRRGRDEGRNLKSGQSQEAEGKEMSSGLHRARRGSKAGTGSMYTHTQEPLALQEDNYMQVNQNFEPYQSAKRVHIQMCICTQRYTCTYVGIFLGEEQQCIKPDSQRGLWQKGPWSRIGLLCWAPCKGVP